MKLGKPRPAFRPAPRRLQGVELVREGGAAGDQPASAKGEVVLQVRLAVGCRHAAVAGCVQSQVQQLLRVFGAAGQPARVSRGAVREARVRLRLLLLAHARQDAPPAGERVGRSPAEAELVMVVRLFWWNFFFFFFFFLKGLRVGWGGGGQKKKHTRRVSVSQ